MDNFIQMGDPTSLSPTRWRKTLPPGLTANRYERRQLPKGIFWRSRLSSAVEPAGMKGARERKDAGSLDSTTRRIGGPVCNITTSRSCPG
eukprot:2875353-Rhodomonas_salina.2